MLSNDFKDVSNDIETETILSDPFLIKVERTNLVDQTPEFIDNWFRTASNNQANLQIASQDLSDLELTHQQVLSIYLDKSLKRDSFRFNQYPITHIYGSHIDALNLALTAPLNSKKDADNYIKLLNELELEFGKLIDALEHRRGLGMVVPSFVLRRVILQCDDLASDSAHTSPFYTRFEQAVNDIGLMDPKTKQQFLDNCLSAVQRGALPGYKRLTAYLRQLEQTSLSIAGVWQMENGKEFHRHLLFYHTGVYSDVDELYELGKLNLSAIEGEISILYDLDQADHSSSMIESNPLLQYNGIPMPAYSFGLALFKERELLTETDDLKPAERVNFLIKDQLATAKLITDIGIHSKQWLRDQAIGFLAKNSVLDIESSTDLVDEIIAMPGWHASDKIGLMRLSELQESHPETNVLKLAQQLGPVPLEVLELQLTAETKAALASQH